MSTPPARPSGAPSTAGQVQAHRFALRRVASALVRGDAVPARDPLRTHGRATLAGVVLAVVAVGVSAIWGVLHRAPDWRAQTLVVAERSGALAVVVDRARLVGVPNLASARLVLAARGGADASSAIPVEIPDGDLAGAPRDAPVGIPDAPALPPPGTPAPAVWSVCDAATPGPGPGDSGWARPRVTTTVVAGAAPPGRPLARTEALVLADRAGGVWLVHDGVRSRVDTADSAVVEALGLGGVLPRPVTTGLLNALPEGTPLVAPRIEGAGGPTAVDLAGERIGGVLRVVGPGVPDRYLVIEPDGLQEVTPLVARLVRLSDPDPVRAVRPIPVISPAQIGPFLESRRIPVAGYPDPAPVPVALPLAPTTCVGVSAAGPTVPTVSATAPPPGTLLAQADGSGDRVDVASVPGGGVAVRAVATGRPEEPGPAFVVSGSGTTFTVPDPAAVVALGLAPDAPEGATAALAPAPRSVLTLLPAGSSLAVTSLRPLESTG